MCLLQQCSSNTIMNQMGLCYWSCLLVSTTLENMLHMLVDVLLQNFCFFLNTSYFKFFLDCAIFYSHILVPFLLDLFWHLVFYKICILVELSYFCFSYFFFIRLIFTLLFVLQRKISVILMNEGVFKPIICFYKIRYNISVFRKLLWSLYNWIIMIQSNVCINITLIC